MRDYESTTYVSSFKSIDEFGPLLRQEAIRRGMGSAGQVVLLVDGAKVLKIWAKTASKAACKSWTFTTPCSTRLWC